MMKEKTYNRAKISSMASWLAVVLCIFFPIRSEAARDQPQTDSQAINAVQFTDDMWSEEFIIISETVPHYLSLDQEFVLPPPPANDSDETAAELKELLRYQRELRTPEQVEKIIIEQKGQTDLRFGLGRKLPVHVEEAVNNLRNASTQEVDPFIYREKYRYKRPRPTQLEPELTMVIPLPMSAAYPSGHATIARIGANVFSYIDPANKEAYMKFADDVALRRCISGIHYPTDGTAGQMLADQVFKALLDVPAYRSEIDRVKKMFDDAQVESLASLKGIHFGNEGWNPEFLKALEDGPVYLDKDTVFEIAAFPANESAETQRELDLLRFYARSRRTPDEVKKIKEEDGASSILLTGGPLIDQFDHNPGFKTLWPKAYREITYFLMREKRNLDRPRPTQLAPDLTTVVPVPGHAAYPSGHAAHTMLLALILGGIDEEHRNEYIEMASAIGERREIAGLHYPSDTRAGVKLAQDIYAKLMDNSEFRKEFDQAKTDFLNM